MNYETIDWTCDASLFIEYLKSISEDDFRDFSKKITPGEFTILGVRLPILKSIAKDISKYDYRTFLEIDTQDIFEVKVLKGYVIGSIKDIQLYKQYFHEFLPSIDNWAICDTFIAASKIIKKYPNDFLDEVRKLLNTSDVYYNRVALVILRDYFANSIYIDEVFSLIENYKPHEYYANMALAWLLSECYIRCCARTKEYLNTHNIDREVMRYTIRKIKDSHRVSIEDKLFLDAYKC